MNKILEGAKAISGTIGFNFLPKELRQVTFYSEGKNYWPHLKGLLETTLVKTNKKFVMLALLLMIQELKLIIQI